MPFAPFIRNATISASAPYNTGRPVQVVCSGVVDREVMVTNLAGHSMKLTRDEDGSVEVAGVKLFMRDKMTTNGVIHVIGEKLSTALLVVTLYVHDD